MSYPFEVDPSSAFVERYRGILISAIYELLDKLQSQGVSSKLVLDNGAASFIELVLFDFILKICARVKPQSADDLSSYIVIHFPEPLKSRYSECVVELFASAPVAVSGSIFSRSNFGSNSSSSSALVMPVDKIQQMLSKDILHTRADGKMARFLASLLQVIVNDILIFVRRYVIELQIEVIGESEVRTAITADRCFLSIFAPDGGAALIGKSSRSPSEDDTAIGIEFGDDDKSSVVSIPTLGPGSVCDTISMVTVTPAPTVNEEEMMDYTDQVKRLLTDETANVRDLHTIIRLFKAPLDAILRNPITSEDIFCNVDEVLIAAEAVLSTLEDTFEAADESGTPLIGDALLELAGEAVLDVYRTYADTVLSPSSSNLLASILQKPEIFQRLDVGSTYSSRIRNYADCFRYVLPRLLLRPLQHCWKFFEHLESLVAADSSQEASEDRNFLHQSISALHPVRARLTPYQKTLQRQRKPSRQQSLDEVARLGKLLESWRDKPLQQFCTELVHEGPVYKHNQTRRNASERYILLFDTIVLLCKRNQNSSSSNSASRIGSIGRLSSSSSSSNLNYTYRVKEKLMLRNVNVRLIDLADCPEYANAFQIENYSLSESSTGSSASPTMFDSIDSMSVSSLSSSTSSSTSTTLLTVGHSKGSYILLAPSPQEKQSWLYHFLWLLSKASIDRQLDAILNEPTQFKLAESYQFSKPDKPGENIIFEESNAAAGVVTISGGPPLVRGATLKKLIERLTYHEYSDTRFMKTFATTYRSFCKPRELLRLLIDRFRIPGFQDQENGSMVFIETEEERRQATEIRKFRKEYVKPVQFRVLNFIRHWILQHSYDFSDDAQLRKELVDFINSIRAPHLRRWVTRLLAHVEKIGQAAEERETVFDQCPPPILYHLKDRPISLMTLHPIELARQVTLLEFAAFKKIRPCELSGTAWTKSTKYETSPNVMRATDFHNEFTYWLERNIVETKNLEERVAVCERIADILQEFKKLNNFSGQFCVSSAFSSSCVHRLKLTKAMITKEKMDLIEDAIKMGDNHYRIYEQRLRMCNPPCTPFLGMWKTRLLHVDEGNRDFLAENVINFNKWRRTADFLTEIQQYQNQPYCLEMEPEIRDFFERLDPRTDLVSSKEDTDKFENILYDLSLEIEPKQRNNASPPIFPKRFEFPLTPPAAAPSLPSAASSSALAGVIGSGALSRRGSRDVPAAKSSTLTTAPSSASRRGFPPRAAPLVLATTASFSNDDSSTDSRGPSSSSSLPGTPFPTPPSSATSHLQHFFSTSGGPPPLPPRPNDSVSSGPSPFAVPVPTLLPPPPPQRPLPSPGYYQTNMAPPLPPRTLPPLPNSAGSQTTSAGANTARTRFEYPTPPQAPPPSRDGNNNTLAPPELPASHRRQNSQ